jgi:Amt family ammonium transporter
MICYANANQHIRTTIMKISYALPIVLTLLLTSTNAFAQQDMATMQISMDVVWVVTAAALVFFMQAGFALLESGMTRAKNSINVIMKNYVDVCVGSMVFWAVGYGLMFGSNPSGFVGVDHFFPHGLSAHEYAMILFQTMFAATATTIASGAMAERTQYTAYLMGAIVVTVIIYPVFGSWAWGSQYDGKGWLAEMGFIDFAGSTVVHSIGGWVALAGIMILGPRLGRFAQNSQPRIIPGHNLTMVALGGFILWLGWFGFNGGSTVAATADIGLITLNTHLAAAAGASSTLLILWLTRQPIMVGTIVNGSLGGLVAITSGCATMEPVFAMITGLIAGIVLIWSTSMLESLLLDDVVGAVPVHAFCGAWGTLAAGLFKTGDLFNPSQVIVQMTGIIAAFLWAFPLALLMYFFLHKTIGLRAGRIAEQRGLDYAEHNEIGYPEFQQEILHGGQEKV